MDEKLTLLVVDDESAMRAGVERALRSHLVNLPEFERTVSYECVEAATGEEAIARLEERDYDLMLLDYKLPGITGLDVLRRLSDENREIVTIVITAYASLDTAIAATKHGAYDFLAKPFTPNELKASIAKATKHLIAQRRARELAEEKRRVRFEFLSVLSHELKSPLSAIEGYLYLLEDPAFLDDKDTTLDIVKKCIARIQGARKLIFDLLDVTRIESGTKKRDIANFDLMDAVRDAVSAVAIDTKKRDITIEVHAADTIPVRADRSELDIVLNNLVSNAVKYNRDGGRVDVRVQRDAALDASGAPIRDTLGRSMDNVVIEVADTGIGLSKEDIAKLFKDFVRIKNKKTSGILGSGLGLSTLKKLAILNGGDVTVDSTPDAGSTFTVTIRAEQ